MPTADPTTIVQAPDVTSAIDALANASTSTSTALLRADDALRGAPELFPVHVAFAAAAAERAETHLKQALAELRALMERGT